MWVIALFVTNWFVAVFFQSSFHHRYASHRMFTMSEAMERIFHVGTWLVQVKTDTGLTGTATILVTDVTVQPAPVVVELR